MYVIKWLTRILYVVQLMTLDMKTPGQSALAPDVVPPPPARWKALVSDWAVLVSAGAILLSSCSLATLEPFLPTWLEASFGAKKWQLGLVFLPDSTGYLLGTHLLGEPALRLGRWRVATVAMLLLGVSAVLVSSATAMWHLALPHLGLGLGVGSVDAALVPLLAYLVDSRHGAGYGAVYALQQAAVSMAYALGPMLGGLVVRAVGFRWLMRAIGAINILYCPLLLLLARLSDPEQRPLGQASVNYKSGDYTRFQDSDDSD